MKITIAAMVASGLLFAGCGSDSEGGGSSAETATLGQEAATTYSQIAYQAYSDSLETAQALDDALTALVDEPTQASQEAAKAAWLDAREPYLQTEVYRFYNGPIDNPENGPECQLNCWPMDESYVDYIEDDPDTGIINDTALPIDEETLRGKNEEGGEEFISVGYHPIEFLLWGQDNTEPAEEMPGLRPHTDYLTEGGTADNQDRRQDYLDLLGDLMIDDLQFLVDSWSPDDESNYRAGFEGGAWEDALTKMLTGMIILSGFEMAGERLQTALDNGDQEDEHSCFSDNTHRDMVQDARGIQNVWLGQYRALNSADSVDGTGIVDVVASVDPELADEITDQIEESVQLAEALRPDDSDEPFDLLISLGNTEGNAKVQALIDSLRAQEELLQEAFRRFGFSVPEPPQ